MLTPKARPQDDFVTTMVGDEMVIYDRQRHQGHSLSQTAAYVCQHCDGHMTVADLSGQVEQEFTVSNGKDIVHLALDCLQ